MLPTLREKRHYLAIEILSSKNIDEKDVRIAIHKAVNLFLGYESALAGVKILELKSGKKKYDLKSFKGILSVNRKYDLKVKASLAVFSQIKEIKIMSRIIGVSGTLKRLREKFLR